MLLRPVLPVKLRTGAISSDVFSMWAAPRACGEGLVQQSVQIVASHDLTLVVGRMMTHRSRERNSKTSRPLAQPTKREHGALMLVPAQRQRSTQPRSPRRAHRI